MNLFDRKDCHHCIIAAYLFHTFTSNKHVVTQQFTTFLWFYIKNNNKEPEHQTQYYTFLVLSQTLTV